MNDNLLVKKGKEMLCSFLYFRTTVANDSLDSTQHDMLARNSHSLGFGLGFL
jgi:hypothetical protein